MSSTVTPYQHDLLARKPFADRLEKFLMTEHHFVDGALVLTLNGEFGSGKSTFIRMWTADLLQRRRENRALPRPVVINAWESDHCGDPLVAILAALKDALSEGHSSDPQPEKANRLKDAVKDLAWYGLGLANGFVAQTTGLDPIAAKGFAEGQAKDRENARAFFQGDVLEVFEKRRGALAKIKEALAAAFGGDEVNAIVVIDELDRCRPDYAVSYLETIKHIFDTHGIAFVLCVDEKQLASTVSVLFGGQVVFPEYYRKFSHRTVRLAKPTEPDFVRLTTHYVRTYLSREGKRWSALEPRGPAERIHELFGELGIRPRQAQEAFRIFSHAFSRPEKYDRGVYWTYADAMIAMATLRVARPDLYETLRRPNLTPKEAEAVANEVFVTNTLQRDWWFQFVAAHLKQTETWEAEVMESLVRLKVIQKREDLEIGRWHMQRTQRLDSDSNFFTMVAEKIEKVVAFTEN